MISTFLASLFESSSNWNIILLVIGGCSILSFTIFVERLIQLRKSEIDTNGFVINMRNCINDGNIIEAVGICEDSGGTIAKIIKAGLLKHNLTKEQISFSEEYAASGRDGNLNDPQFISRLIRDHRPPVMIKNSVINEPVGQVYREAFNPSKTHRRVNASALAPQDAGQDQLRLFARSGRWV